MNIKDLQYLVAVADLQRFGRAAERCHVSQPTLSMQLKKLEETLGLQLFERQPKHVMPTSAGEQVIAQARVVLQDIEALTVLAQQIRAPLSGTFHLGAIPTLGPYLLPRVLPYFKQQLPNLRFQLQEMQTHTLITQLKQGQLDAILLALPVAGIDDFICRPLFEEDFVLAVPKDHALAAQDTLTIDAVSVDELLLLGEGHCLKDHALSVCQHIRNPDHARYQGTSLSMLIQMVALGEGITLLPKLVADTVNTPEVALQTFTAPAPHRQIGMLWRTSSAKKAACQHIMDCIKTAVAAT